MWASQYWRFEYPYTWVNSGGLGTMGFAVPAAIGAKVGRPDRTVWAIDGDGCFQMTAQELVTATRERIPVKIAILNNAYLGMVRQWQEMFYEERYSEVYLSPDLPDYVEWAEAMGCVGIRVETPEEVAPAIEKANAIDDRPVVIDFRTDADGEGLPDGAGRGLQRRHHGRPSQAARAPRRGHERGPEPLRPTATASRCWSRTRPVCWHGWPACSRDAATTSTPWPWPRPTTSASAASRSSWTSSRRRSSRSWQQLDKLVNVVEIGELHPDEAARARAAARERLWLRRAAVARSSSWSACSGARIVDVGHDAMTVMLAGAPEAVDDFEDLMSPYGIVGLQRTGRVALPKLDERLSARRRLRPPPASPRPRVSRLRTRLTAPSAPDSIPHELKDRSGMAKLYYEKDADSSLVRTARWPSSATARRATPTP